MNFDYDEEQQLLADSVRRLLQKDYDFEARKRVLASPGGASAAFWSRLAAMGVLGLPLPAAYGGFGGSAVDLMGVMEAFGEALVVEPVLPTWMAARCIALGGNDVQKAAWLPRVAAGEAKLALAYAEAGTRYGLRGLETVASRDGAGWTLAGEKRMVLGAPLAEALIVCAMAEGAPALYLVRTQATSLRSYRTLDNLAAADVRLESAAGERLEGGAALLEEIIDWATALVCAEAVGAMKSACDATLEYLKTRKQFGVPIGTFQALQHRMVDLYIEQEQARSMACLACSKVDHASSSAERARAVSGAKIRVADAARRVSQESVQLHGGMGMTEELKVSHTFRRLTALAQQFGDADHHLERFASLN